MCCTPSASKVSTKRSMACAVCPGVPSIRSTETFRKPGRLRHPHAFLRLDKAVPAAQCLQLAVRGGLHPHRDAVKAPFPQRLRWAKVMAAGFASSVILAFRLHRKVPPHRGQNLQKSLSQQHRRAAAKVDAVHRLPRCGGRFHRPAPPPAHTAAPAPRGRAASRSRSRGTWKDKTGYGYRFPASPNPPFSFLVMLLL